jgi:hypothetical protein
VVFQYRVALAGIGKVVLVNTPYFTDAETAKSDIAAAKTVSRSLESGMIWPPEVHPSGLR